MLKKWLNSIVVTVKGLCALERRTSADLDK